MFSRNILLSFCALAVLCGSVAFAQVNYSITGTISGAMGPDPLKLNGAAVSMSGSLDQGATPSKMQDGPGFSSRTYSGIAGITVNAGSFSNLQCTTSATTPSVTLVDVVTGSDSLTLSNCNLDITTLSANISIPGGNMVAAVPASIPSVNGVGGTVSYVCTSPTICKTDTGTTTTFTFNGSMFAGGTAPPAVGLNPTTWSPSAPQGSTTPIPMGITLSASAPVSYTTSAMGSGISVSLQYGNTLSADGTTNPGKLFITANPSGLAAGMHSGSVTINYGGNLGSANINVNFNITSVTPPALTANPTSMTFNYTIGGTAPTSQGLSINTNPASTTAITAAVTSGNSWLNLSSCSGSTPVNCTVSVSTTGLSAGMLSGNIQITATGVSNSPLNIPVTYNVTAPTLTVPTSQLTFNYTLGGTAPAAQMVSVGGTSGISFTAANGGSSWLSVSPGSGSVPNTLTIGIVTAGLQAQTYNGTVTVMSTGATGSPAMIAVVLYVSPAPTLTVPSTPLTFNYTLGGSAPPSQTVSVGGTSGLAFTASNNGSSWLGVSPGNGNVPNSLTVSIITAGLSAQTYNGTITVTSTGAAGSPVSIPVTLNVTAPTLSAAPSSLTFNYQSGGTAPAAQSINVSGTSGIAFSVSTSGGAWLSASPTNGTVAQSVSVSVNPSGLAAGAYNGTVTVSSTGANGSPATVSVTLNVTAPTLTATPSSLNFSYQVGGSNPQAQTVNVGGTAGQSFTAAASGGAWLSVTPGSGSTPGSVSVSVSPSGLAANTYNGTVTISAAGAASQTVNVTLLVTTAPTISASPGSLTFAYQTGGSVPAGQAINIGGTSGLSYSLAASGGSWLAVNPANGTTPGNATVTVSPAALAAGTYNGSITVTASGASNSPATIAVTLTVSAAPALTVSPSSLKFSYTLGGSAPAAQSLSIGSSGSPISFTAAAGGAGWLSVSPTNGTTPGSLSVTVDASSLTAGTYNASITVTSAGASNSPQTVPVQLVVGSAPTITATPNQLSFAYQLGGTAPAAQTVSIGGTAGLTAAVSVTGGNWLSVTPPSGTSPFTVSATVNTNGLAAGTYNASITITANGASNSPVTVGVKLVVSTLPTITASPASVTFTAAAGGSAPPSQSVNITGTSALAFTAAASGGSWLSVTPGSGTTPAALTVSADPSKLTAGSYTGSITVTAATAGNSPLTISVTFTVTPPPGPSISAILSASSYLSTGFAPGDILAIFGGNMGPATAVSFTLNAAGKLDNTLATVQVNIDGVPAIPLFVSQNQINVIMPFTTNITGESTVVITYGGASSTGFKIPLAASDVGLFTANASGSGPGAILNQDYSYNTAGNPAPKMSVVSLFGTGGGMLNPAVNAGDVAGSALSMIPLNVTATVNGENATVLYAGSAPTLVYGVNQFNIQIPADAQSGQAVIVVTVGNSSSQANVTVFVQ